MDLKKLVNKGVDSLSPYEPGKPIEDLEREIGIKNAIKSIAIEHRLRKESFHFLLCFTKTIVHDENCQLNRR